MSDSQLIENRFSEDSMLRVLDSSNSIDLGLNYQALPFLSITYCFFSIITCFIIYLIQGRFAGYLPTVSETGTEYPNTQIFAHANATTSIATGLSLVLLMIFIQLTQSTNGTQIFWMRLLAFFNFIGILGVGVSPLNEVQYQHYFFALLGFISIVIFEVVSFLVIKDSSYSTKVFRGTLLSIGFFALITFLFADYFCIDRYMVTLSTLGEYFLFFSIQTYLFSFRSELKTIKITLFLE